jgi:hypothetical protein
MCVSFSYLAVLVVVVDVLTGQMQVVVVYVTATRQSAVVQWETSNQIISIQRIDILGHE